MAVYNINTIIDGPRHVVIQVGIEGTGGDAVGDTLLDISTLTPLAARLVIEKVTASLEAFSATLSFDRTTDVLFAALPASNHSNLNFKDNNTAAGGWLDDGTGGTGDILISTTGIVAGVRGVVEIVARKKDS